MFNNRACGCCNDAPTTPGRISGSPLTGLCTRVCIEVPTIVDACTTRTANESKVIALSNFTPSELVSPLTYVSTMSVSGAAYLTNKTVTPIKCNECRVTCSVNIPVETHYTDSNGRSGVATGTVIIPRDIIMNIPLSETTPYEIDVTANLYSVSGAFVDATHVSIACCILEQIAVVVHSQILVPSYGAAEFPEATNFTSDLCEAVLELPLYPSPRCRK